MVLVTKVLTLTSYHGLSSSLREFSMEEQPARKTGMCFGGVASPEKLQGKLVLWKTAEKCRYLSQVDLAGLTFVKVGRKLQQTDSVAEYEFLVAETNEKIGRIKVEGGPVFLKYTVVDLQ